MLANRFLSSSSAFARALYHFGNLVYDLLRVRLVVYLLLSLDDLLLHAVDLGG